MEEIIKLPLHEEVISMSDLYTLGVFQDAFHYGRRRAMTSQAFYRINSDYPKDSGPEPLQIGLFIGWNTLS